MKNVFKLTQLNQTTGCLTRGRHPQQEEGDLHPVHAPGQADLGQEEEESENIVLVQINFHFLHCTLRILKIFVTLVFA